MRDFAQLFIRLTQNPVAGVAVILTTPVGVKIHLRQIKKGGINHGLESFDVERAEFSLAA